MGMGDRALSTSELLPVGQPNTLSNWFVENIGAPVVNAGPLAIYNTAAQFVDLPEARLQVGPADPYSFNWFVQGVSGGVGSVLPFMLAAAGTGYAMRSANRMLAGTAAGATLNPYLMSDKVAAVSGAMLFGGLQKPEEGHTRLGNALGAGVGFAVFAGGNHLTKDLTGVAKALSYPAIGFVGGMAMSETSALVSTGKLAPTDQMLQAAVQGATMNTVIPLAQRYLLDRPTQPPVEQRLKEAERLRVQSLVDRNGEPIKLSNIDDIVRVSREYTEWVKQNKPQYPLPEQFAKMTPEEIVQRGFQHPDLKGLDFLDYIEYVKGKKPRPLPDAKVVATEVGKSVAEMPLAKPDGQLILGEWNMEFLTADKAKYFRDTYSHVIPRHHLLFMSEVDAAGLAQLAKDNGYNYAISQANSRGQAVGFMVNPRLKILGTQSYDNVANVFNIPDLRPAFRIDVLDTANNQKMSAVVVHLKSMRGGPEQTAPVRVEQARQLAGSLEPNFRGVIAGDWNTFLERTTDLNPLKQAGFKILSPNDASTTQAMGGRLDGFLYKGMEGFSEQQVRPFFKNPLITRGLSDHALLTTTLGSDSGS